MKPTKTDLMLKEQHGGHGYKRNSRALKRLIQEDRKLKYEDKERVKKAGMTGKLANLSLIELDELLNPDRICLN
jgi:hypothetical protein